MFIPGHKIGLLTKKLSFWVLVCICIIMGVATFFEKDWGAESAYNTFYGTWWFVFLWFFLVIMSVMGLIKGKVYKDKILFLLHLSFVVILLGALCTHLFSEQAYITLQKNSPVTSITANNRIIHLPFSIKLDSFHVDVYPGTDSPSDYISHITVGPQAGENRHAEISMNHIFEYKGFRFYQSSFTPDRLGSILSVNYDPWGIPITYCGYLLFAISMLGYLLNPHGKFRQLLCHPLLKIATVLLFISVPIQTSATNTISSDSITIDRNQATKFGQLCILYEGRVSSISAFAHDFTLKLIGNDHLAHLNAEQILMGFLFLPAKWQRVALFEVDNHDLQRLLDSSQGKAALIDFFDDSGNYKLAQYKDIIIGRTGKSVFEKEVIKLNDKVQLINMLHTGELLQIYPVRYINGFNWIQPVAEIPIGIGKSDSLFIRTSLSRYYLALLHNKSILASEIINQISDYQQKQAGDLLPSNSKLQIEIWYLKVNLIAKIFKINLTLGILFLFSLLFLGSRAKKYMYLLGQILTICSFIILTINLGVRAYVAGYFPISNGFETMQFIAWCALIPTLIMAKRIPILIPFGFIISGAALLVAHLGMSNPKITPLMPVLSSPLLSIHVSLIMIAYTLFAFIAINSLSSLIQIICINKKRMTLVVETLEKNRLYSLVCLYPAIFLLGCGIFIGAIWANISWGQYWSWDPKEVWALITFLTYAITLHENIPFVKSIFWFQVYGLTAFATVLMTYFGVNYFLGGMHSYAGEAEYTAFVPILAGTIVILLLVLVAYYKYRKILSIPLSFVEDHSMIDIDSK